MKKQYKNISIVLIVIIFIVWVSWNFRKANQFQNAQKILTNGLIQDCYYGGRGNAGRTFIDFKFVLNGVQIKGSSVILTSEIPTEDLKNFFTGKAFPVLYDPKQPTNSTMLIIPKDFNRYNYSFPDSLQWVYNYMANR